MPNANKFNAESLRVLIVDDHDPIRKAIKRVLQSMKFADITETYDGSEAITLLNEKKFDIVICDLYMRKVDGFEVLNAVRNRNFSADIPFIIVTGEASKEDIVKAADLGADDYVLKPFQVSDLEEKVTSVLNKFYEPSELMEALRRAEGLVLEGKYKKALAYFDEALRLQPESQRAGLGKALTYDAMGNQQTALDLLRDNATKNPSYHKNFRAMADIHLKLKNNTLAIECMDRELAINTKQVDRQIKLAKLLIKDNSPAKAIEHFRAALKELPKHRSALMGIGQAFADIDNLEKALYYFRRVRRYHPDHTKALDAAVRCCFAAQANKKAELFLIDEKRGHPDRADTYLALAKVYVHDDRNEDAIKILHELILRQPENHQAYRLSGIINIRIQKFPEAVTALVFAVKFNPNAENHLSLGEAYLGHEKFDLAISELHKSVCFNNKSPHAFFLLGKCFRAIDQFGKAHLMFRASLAKGGNPEKCMANAKNCLGFIKQRRVVISSSPIAS